MKVEEGKKVKVHYTGTLDDGTQFDSSEGRDPLEFVVGAKMMIPGFEKGILGKEVGDEIELKLLPGDAYGEVNQKLIQEVPKKGLPEGLEVKEGTMLMLKAPTGQQLPAKVMEVKEETFMIDLNHPLAGKNLNFKVKIEDIEDMPEQKTEEAPAEAQSDAEEKKSEE